MTLSVRCGYRKMQPIFFSFVSGLHYRKTVKLYFRRISTFDLVVSICENMLFQRFSSFLTAGNKSYCGTLQRLTHPQQSTAKPIFSILSRPNCQVLQRKLFALSSVSTQTSSHPRRHRTSVLSTPQKLPGTLIRTTSTPNLHPRRPPATPQTLPQPHRIHTPDALPDTPPPHPKVARNSSRTPFPGSSKTAEYQRSDFKT